MVGIFQKPIIQYYRHIVYYIQYSYDTVQYRIVYRPIVHYIYCSMVWYTISIVMIQYSSIALQYTIIQYSNDTVQQYRSIIQACSIQYPLSLLYYIHYSYSILDPLSLQYTISTIVIVYYIHYLYSILYPLSLQYTISTIVLVYYIHYRYSILYPLS